MKGKFIKLLASAAMATSLLAGCSSGSGVQAQTYKKGDTVKLGLNFELTGSVASYGKAEYNGAKLAIKQYNAKKGHKYKIKYESQDDKGDAAESTKAAQKLITEDGVAALIGPATSSASIATYQTATDNKVPVISPSATQQGAMENDGKVYDYAFRVCFEDSYQASAMAKFASQNLGKKRAVVINEVSDYGKGLADTFTKKFKSYGGEVVATESYNAGDTDFASIITKVQKQDFDVMYLAGYYTECGLIIKQAKEAGVNATILGADGFESEVLAKQAGAQNLNDVYYTTAYTTVNASDQLKEFIDAYHKEYGTDPNMFSALAYDSTNLVLQALDKSGAGGEKLQKQIKNIKFSGVTGTFTFDKKHSPVKAVMVVNQVNGKQTEAVPVTPDK